MKRLSFCVILIYFIGVCGNCWGMLSKQDQESSDWMKKYSVTISDNNDKLAPINEKLFLADKQIVFEQKQSDRQSNPKATNQATKQKITKIAVGAVFNPTWFKRCALPDPEEIITNEQKGTGSWSQFRFHRKRPDKRETKRAFKWYLVGISKQHKTAKSDNKK